MTVYNGNKFVPNPIVNLYGAKNNEKGKDVKINAEPRVLTGNANELDVEIQKLSRQMKLIDVPININGNISKMTITIDEDRYSLVIKEDGNMNENKFAKTLDEIMNGIVNRYVGMVLFALINVFGFFSHANMWLAFLGGLVFLTPFIVDFSLGAKNGRK